jgi:hypothetical protein
LVKTAAVISSHILKSQLLHTIETIIDEEQSITHRELAEKTAKFFEDPSSISKRVCFLFPAFFCLSFLLFPSSFSLSPFSSSPAKL